MNPDSASLFNYNLNSIFYHFLDEAEENPGEMVARICRVAIMNFSRLFIVKTKDTVGLSEKGHLSLFSTLNVPIIVGNEVIFPDCIES